ncbi:phage holin family protein [Gloeothece verrucosa]|uniref:Phage holin family protein n=1 Tax=Gloeothece verrucosa (strain PCC 7822) TaxID=497965 RepID=E0UB59_GLOV7|nr:phage holin family protein [Gloeothece verrucosa]ADN16304.1 membrane protein of unknown function [Gloeothece verrucosa PCC 7822]
MPRFLITWIVTAVSLMITANIVPGIEIKSWTTAAIGAIILGLVNAVVRPILKILTFPITILTLGLFLFIINAICFSLVGYLSGFKINSFWDALIGSIVFSLVSWGINLLIGNKK